MIFAEAFVPSARRFFWKRQRFPIADAHYAMGFSYLAQVTKEQRYYQRAVHFLDVLEKTRSQGFEHHGWGYPFNWETRGGTIWAGTPLITSIPYVYEAFLEVYRIDGESRWRTVMQSIADHALYDYRDHQVSETASSCSYTPDPNDPAGVVNASAYRSFLLTRAAADFSEPRYQAAADRNLNFVLDAQNADGSWYYSVDGKRDFVDHFHTCFVLKALAKIEALTGNARCTAAISRGIEYYLQNLFDDDGLPKPFSRRPRLTVYKNELYDYAESVNLAVLLRGRFPALDLALSRLLDLSRWQNAGGSFRARKLLLGWDNTPMHRWAQAQMFRSLTFFLCENSKRVPPAPRT